MATVVDPFSEQEKPTPAGGLTPGSVRLFIQDELGIRDIRDVRLLTRLITSGALPQGEAEEFVLAAQARHRSMIEHALDSGLMDEGAILAVTAELYELAAVLIDEVPIDEGISGLVPPETERLLQALPYARTADGELLIAIADASRQEFIEGELKKIPALAKERLGFRLSERSALSSRIDTLMRSRPIAAPAEYREGPADLVNLRASDFASNPTGRLFADLLGQAVAEGASDLHIESEAQESLIRFRVDGKLNDVMRVPAQLATPLIAMIKTRGGMLAHEKRTPQDGRFTEVADGHRVDLRVVSIPIQGGDDLEQMVMRLQDPNRAMLSLTQLGMTESDYKRYLEAIDQPYGFMLASGPTGSGKTTTLYASLQVVNHPDMKLMSVEDPVELSLPGVMQIEVPRQGDDRWGFKDVLPSIVRSDPDIIMVGEIRDPETANLALNASLTGHFVYSTLHANNAITTIVRLQELGVEPFLIAEALEIIVAQRLVRRVCDCAEPKLYTPSELAALHAPPDAITQAEEAGGIELRVANPRGCSKCRSRGYRGRVGVFELLIVNTPIRDAILNRTNMLDLNRLARETGMRTLREDGWIKVSHGLTTLEELNREIKHEVR
jgi:type IV pilus assembly protein PilB